MSDDSPESKIAKLSGAEGEEVQFEALKARSMELIEQVIGALHIMPGAGVTMAGNQSGPLSQRT